MRNIVQGMVLTHGLLGARNAGMMRLKKSLKMTRTRLYTRDPNLNDWQCFALFYFSLPFSFFFFFFLYVAILIYMPNPLLALQAPQVTQTITVILYTQPHMPFFFLSYFA